MVAIDGGNQTRPQVCWADPNSTATPITWGPSYTTCSTSDWGTCWNWPEIQSADPHIATSGPSTGSSQSCSGRPSESRSCKYRTQLWELLPYELPRRFRRQPVLLRPQTYQQPRRKSFTSMFQVVIGRRGDFCRN